MTNPYASFTAYWAAGWRGILPLPYGKKGYPPEGLTGYSGADPSYADCQAWSEDGPRNIALRMPDGAVGIDVDHYDGKTGGDTLGGLVAKFGALPPTAYSSSRGDGISGIRCYRVPPGTTLPTKLPGIEFIQHHHRYTVAWPSIHPNGGIYHWIDERTGDMLDGPPQLSDLPELPTAWIDGLSVEAKNHEKADLDADQALAILAAMPTGDPCPHVLAHAGKAIAGGDRHDSYNEAALAVVGAGRRGCPGAPGVVQRLRATFIAEITAPGQSSRRSVPEAEAEWRRGLLGALAIIAGEPQGTVCPDDVLDWIDDPDDDQTLAEDATEPSPYDLAVKRKLGELLIIDAAKDALASRKAGAAPPLGGINLEDFLNQPDEKEQYRIGTLWPVEGRVLIPAAAKSGKTTIVLNLIRALVDGGQFLGMFDAIPVTRRVVYLNLEVSAGKMRQWLRKAGIANRRRVHVENMRGRVAALALDSTAGRQRLAEWLRSHDAEIVILDPLAPALAAFGLDENSNADVAKFFSWWSEVMANAGVVDDAITHHAGHDGQRSRGASRLLDEPDAIWTITRGTAKDDGKDDVYGPQEIRFLRAMGRDVDLIDTALEYDDDTKTLTLRDGVTKQDVKKEGVRTRILAYVETHPGSSRSAVKTGVGGHGQTAWDEIGVLIDAGEIIETGRKCYANR